MLRGKIIILHDTMHSNQQAPKISEETNTFFGQKLQEVFNQEQMCESHTRHVNEDRGHIPIVFKARISGKGSFARERKLCQEKQSRK